MHIRILTCLLLLTAYGFTATAQDKWDLTRAVEYALENNISVKQTDIQARLAALTHHQSRLNRLPTASLSGNFGVNSGRAIDPTTNLFTTDQLLFSGMNFNSGMTVFNFFSLKHSIEGNRLELEAANKNIEKIKNDVALNVATAYLLILVAIEQEKVADLSVKLTLQNMENTRSRVEAGALPELNLAELEAQLARDSTALITAGATVRTNILQLKAILNLDAATPFDVETPPLDMIPVLPIGELQPEGIYNEALVNLPQQEVNNLRIEAARAFVKAARGQMYPSLSLFAGMGTQYSNNKIYQPGQPIFTGNYEQTQAKVNINNQDYFIQTPVFSNPIPTGYRIAVGTQLRQNFRQNIGLSLNIPLFNNGVARTQWQRSKLNVSSLELTKEQDLQTLKQNIYTSYNDAVAAIQKFNAGKKGVETAEKAYNFAQKRYELGLLSTIDLLTNQNNLNRARVELSQAQVDYVFRLKLLEFYKGQGLRLR